MRTSDELQRTTGAGAGTTGVVEQAKETVTDAAQQARQMAGEATERAKGTVREQIDLRTTDLGRKLKQNADHVTQLTSTLREQGSEQEARLLETVGQQASRIGDYFESSDAETILRDVESFARRQPWAVAAAAFGIGLLGSRFVKASSYQRSTGGQAGFQQFGTQTGGQSGGYGRQSGAYGSQAGGYGGLNEQPLAAGAMTPDGDTEWE